MRDIQKVVFVDFGQINTSDSRDHLITQKYIQIYSKGSGNFLFNTGVKKILTN